MYEKFLSQSRAEWIDRANLEIAKISKLSFPYRVSLQGIDIQAINTSEDVGVRGALNFRKEEAKPAISLFVENFAAPEQVERLVELGVEDAFLPFKSLDSGRAKVLSRQQKKLTSLAIRRTDSDKSLDLSQALPWLTETGLAVTFYQDQLAELLKNLSRTREFKFPLPAIDQMLPFPQIRGLGISGYLFGDYGATVPQELAFTLSWIAYHWSQYTKRGISLEKLVRQTEVALSIGSDFYPDLLKFGAMRTLLYYLLDCFQVDEPNPYQIKIRAVSGIRNKTLYDPDGNLLRNTSEALSAVLGGADIITLRPHDTHYQSGSMFGQRMAVNIQHLMRHESHLHQVLNPVSGSYFVETATDQLVDKVWKEFVALEEDGGVVSWIENGELARLFAENLRTHEREFLAQKKMAVGVSRFANPNERIRKEQVAEDSLQPYQLHPAERLRFQADQLPADKKPVLGLYIPDAGSNNPVVTQRITYIIDLITSVGLAPKYLTKEDMGESLADPLLKGLIVCADNSWYTTELEKMLQQIALPLPEVMIAGEGNELQELQEAGMVSMFLHPRAQLSDFYSTVEKML